MNKGIWVDQCLMSLSGLQLPSSNFTSEVSTLLFSSSGTSKVKIRISKHSCSFQTLTAHSLPILGHKRCSLLLLCYRQFSLQPAAKLQLTTVPAGTGCEPFATSRDTMSGLQADQKITVTTHTHEGHSSFIQSSRRRTGRHTTVCPGERQHTPAINR